MQNNNKDFDENNVIFEPLIQLEDIQYAETVLMKALDEYRLKSPKGAKLEWLTGIQYEDVKRIVFKTLEANKIDHRVVE